MKKAVIFDMDGVIIQSEMIYKNRRKDFFEKYNIIVDNDFHVEIIGSNPKDMFKLIFPDDLEQQQVALKNFKDFGSDYDIDYERILSSHVEETLIWLKENNYKIALASSGDYVNLIKVLKATQLYSFFDVIVSAADMPHSKPAPDVYLEVISRLGLDVSECVAIEDSNHGIKAAISSGLDCLALKPEDYIVDQNLATEILYSLKDIPLWLS